MDARNFLPLKFFCSIELNYAALLINFVQKWKLCVIVKVVTLKTMKAICSSEIYKVSKFQVASWFIFLQIILIKFSIITLYLANTHHFATVELNTDEMGNENYIIKTLHEIPPEMKEGVNKIITALSDPQPTEETLAEKNEVQLQPVGKSKVAESTTTSTTTPEDTGAGW